MQNLFKGGGVVHRACRKGRGSSQSLLKGRGSIQTVQKGEWQYPELAERGTGGSQTVQKGEVQCHENEGKGCRRRRRE